jgi:uncharacterized RDD family membrane protein YckC
MDGDLPPPAPDYVGLITRAIALAVDSAVINVVALVVEGAAALAIALFHLPKDVRTVLIVIGGIGYVLWTIGYFVGFWSTTGQTPGARVMQIQLVSRSRTGIGPRRALIRCVGMVLAALPLFLGYVLILFDRRCRGLQDRFAGTLVIEAEQQSIAAEARERRRNVAAAAAAQGRSLAEEPGLARQ